MSNSTIQIANQNGTTVGVTDNNRLKVEVGDISDVNTARMSRLATSSTTIPEAVKSISFYNAHASTNCTVNIGGAGNVNLLPGETINFDAGGGSNKFPAGHFVVGSASSDLLTIYVY